MAKRTVVVNPIDLTPEATREADAAEGGINRVWVDVVGFGAFLGTRRLDLNLSLRKAGERIGVSHTHLAQIERGEAPSPLAPDLLRRIAEAYELDERVVLDRAGCRYLVEEDVVGELRGLDRDQFRRLILHPKLVPGGFTEEQLRLFPEAVWRYITEFAERVEANAKAGGPSVDSVKRGES